MIDLGEILEEINVPDLSCPLALESKGVATSKNIFAEQKRHAWDKSVEARCDFSRKVRITRRADVFFISLWQKSLYGRTLTDIKGDDSMVDFFAEKMALRPAILSDVRKCQKPNTQGFSFLLWCFIVPHNAILSLLIRVHFRVRRFSLLIFVYTGLYKLLKRSIAFAFNSSTIAI
jgi:hypothetical protein